MNKLSILAATAAALLINGFAPTPPASAETGAVLYATGGGKLAAIDLTGLHVRNAPRHVEMVAHVRDLTDAGRFTFYMSDPSFEGVFGLNVEVRQRGDGTVVTHFREWGDGWSAARACPDATVRWAEGRDLIRLGFPQGCFHGGLQDQWRFTVHSRLHYGSNDRTERDHTHQHLVLQRG
ncbi:hypothetical protein F0U44_08055 [Nocardioides humilatus]|uniref:Uncharacterized protein n=1 Tax=Nocardioides humilatus TaxID=2607660 RepID=A0A5B1LFA9_9ACTN|nr:hypothetical protein [Nocardioides humilatus]KAA1418460.1 hypothetical protein F0U44_08055 [Nocardioides humilatus]